MANYISQLNGEQMDAALMDVALHNSEAWAVGTRNGYDVEQGDATFHNNAKYYAQVAQSAIPGTYTAAVRWDIAQGLAGEAQEQARANISAGASNRNLLDNPWWGSGEVVNQRSFSSGSTAHNVFCIDRWKTSYGSTAGTISLGADGLTITAASGTYALINQVIDNYTKLTGKTVTCSAMLSNGTVISGTIANLNWDASPVAVTSGSVRLQMLGQGYFRVTILNGGSATIRAVKLELGSYSTLANDVPPDYGEELRKCQRYFWRLGNATYLTACIALAESATQAFGDVILPVPMRAQPSVQSNGTFLCYTGTQSITITSLTGNASSYPTVNPNRVALRATVASGLTIGTFYNIQSRNNAAAYIDFSADL